MKSHWKHNIIWHNFPESNRKIKGVYLIEDLYIGASIHIRSRIIHHINTAYSNLNKYNIIDSELAMSILYLLEINKQINIYYISDNPIEEEKFCYIYKPKLNNLSRCKFYGQRSDFVKKLEL